MELSPPDFAKNLDEKAGLELLSNIGWEESRKRRVIVDENGEISPWYCYSMVFFLRERVKRDMNIFEYGSGFSTIFYAKLAKSVTSVESNEECKKWLEENIAKFGLENAKIYLEKKEDFPNSIEKFDEKFDLVVIDSVSRNECCRACVQKLSEKGVILLDNSERPNYSKAFEFLSSAGFKNITFKGTKPLSTKFASSSLFYKPDNAFEI